MWSAKCSLLFVLGFFFSTMPLGCFGYNSFCYVFIISESDSIISADYYYLVQHFVCMRVCHSLPPKKKNNQLTM